MMKHCKLHATKTNKRSFQGTLTTDEHINELMEFLISAIISESWNQRVKTNVNLNP